MARLKKVKKTNLQSFRSVGSSKKASRESSAIRVGGWSVQVPAYDTWTSMDEGPISRGCRQYETTISVARWCIMLRSARALTSSRFIMHRGEPHTYTCTTGPKRPPYSRVLRLSHPRHIADIHFEWNRSSFFCLSPNRLLSVLPLPIRYCLFVRSTRWYPRSHPYSVFDSCIIQMMAECCESVRWI